MTGHVTYTSMDGQTVQTFTGSVTRHMALDSTGLADWTARVSDLDLANVRAIMLRVLRQVESELDVRGLLGRVTTP